MSTKIPLPSLSPTMEHGTLARWLIGEGEPIKAGQPFVEVETDKSVLEMESPVSGMLIKHLFEEGDENIPIGETIAIIDEGGDVDIPVQIETICDDSSGASSPSTPSTPEAVADLPIPEPMLRISPLAKRLAVEGGVDFHSLKGTGPNGRIIKRDLTAVGTPRVDNVPISAESGMDYIEVPFTRSRKYLADKVQLAKQSVPHFYLRTDIEFDKLIKLRIKLNDGIVTERLSLNDFIIRACAISLSRFPDMNVQVFESGIRKFKAIDIAIAVAAQNGLVAPVIRNSVNMNVTSIASYANRMVSKAREGKLNPAEYQGGTLTISNLGMFGVKSFDAIINTPQGSIIAIGAAENRAVVVGDKIKVATVVSVTLSCDHRAIDGKLGAEFLACTKNLLENPLSLLI